MNRPNPNPHRLGPKLVVGVLMILAGAALVFRNLGILNHDIWHLFWPVALILFGLSTLWSRGIFHFGGHVLIFFGTCFLLANLGHEALPDRWWPLGLVWGGLVIVLRSLLKPTPAPCQDADRGSHE